MLNRVQTSAIGPDLDCQVVNFAFLALGSVVAARPNDPKLYRLYRLKRSVTEGKLLYEIYFISQFTLCI